MHRPQVVAEVALELADDRGDGKGLEGSAQIRVEAETALTRPTWATCRRSSRGSLPLLNLPASRAAIGIQAHTTSCLSADLSGPSGRDAIRRNSADVSGPSSCGGLRRVLYIPTCVMGTRLPGSVVITRRGSRKTAARWGATRIAPTARLRSEAHRATSLTTHLETESLPEISDRPRHHGRTLIGHARRHAREDRAGRFDLMPTLRSSQPARPSPSSCLARGLRSTRRAIRSKRPAALPGRRHRRVGFTAPGAARTLFPGLPQAPGRPMLPRLPVPPPHAPARWPSGVGSIRRRTSALPRLRRSGPALQSSPRHGSSYEWCSLIDRFVTPGSSVVGCA